MTTQSFPDLSVPTLYRSNSTPETSGFSFQHVANPCPWPADDFSSWNSETSRFLEAIDGVGLFSGPDTPLNFLSGPLEKQGSQTGLIGGTTSLNQWTSGGFQKGPPKTSVAGESGHGEISVNSRLCCDECGTPFEKKAALALHAKHTKHAAYICKCGKRCSRLDVLERHIRTFQPTTTHPCPYCNKFRGSKAFTRRDHLLQHWRGHHNIELISDSDKSNSAMGTRPRLRKSLSCPHEDCPYSFSQNSQAQHPFQEINPAFRTQSELTKHLREVHSESPFECTEPYCSRNGGRGFFRKGDLLRHQKEHHPVSTGL
jgi:hypothetical protein